MQNHKYFRQIYRKAGYIVYLWIYINISHICKLWNIWSAVIRINNEGKFLLHVLLNPVPVHVKFHSMIIDCIVSCGFIWCKRVYKVGTGLCFGTAQETLEFQFVSLLNINHTCNIIQ